MPTAPFNGFVPTRSHFGSLPSPCRSIECAQGFVHAPSLATATLSVRAVGAAPKEKSGYWPYSVQVKDGAIVDACQEGRHGIIGVFCIEQKQVIVREPIAA